MNILYFTLDDFDSLLNYHSINTDLIREFQKHGHKVYVISPSEKRKGLPTKIFQENGAVIFKPQIGNIQKTNIMEKGISTLTVGNILIREIKKYFSNVKFDLILYCTPPITFLNAIKYVKARDRAKTYLLLKDIFPQNAVDLDMMSKSGIKGVIYRYFRKKEKDLYKVSDRIGCMSTANVEYVLNHNPEVRKRNDRERWKTGRSIIEVCPNCIEPIDISIDKEEREEIRKKYSIPLDKTVFVYGGNLGKPQGIDFMLKCLHSQRKNDKAFFLIVGNGTEYGKIERYVEKYKPKSIALHQLLPKDEYDKVVAACDVGMIFLDHRFTIPNFPSRLLSYMSAKLPVFAITDTATDIGKVIVDGGFGWWCGSNNTNTFNDIVNEACSADRDTMGKKAWKFLRENYTVEKNCKIILDCLS